jgi:hypothetical protein
MLFEATRSLALPSHIRLLASFTIHSEAHIPYYHKTHHHTESREPPYTHTPLVQASQDAYSHTPCTGLSINSETQAIVSTIHGSVPWAAPELLVGDECTHKADVFR